MSANYITLNAPNGGKVKAWVKGVTFEEGAQQQLLNAASLPIVHGWVAAMPDVHLGIGATVGSVIPTLRAIIPAAVGVDIGCGMMATRTSLTASDLPESLGAMRAAIERAVPHGRTANGRRGDRGAWGEPPDDVTTVWKSELEPRFQRIAAKHSAVRDANHVTHLGSLGTGNHFIEVCLDESDQVWFMLHSGSRGIGNRIGNYFIELARNDMQRTHLANLPDRDLAYFQEGSRHFADYVEAVEWAQDFAAHNRRLMMKRVAAAVAGCRGIPPFQAELVAVNCHHNYVQRERHYGEDVYVTRKGAVRAGAGELGIIPGSMGARSFIVRGKGNPESFHSCSHGAGRVLSRNEAKRRYSVEDQIRATAHVECRKDKDVIDEIPMAYKPIDRVMAAQADLVEVMHELRQVVCVKG